MSNTFEVTILSTREVHTLNGIWDADALRNLLSLAEVDGIDGLDLADLLDMSVMMLQDLGIQQAGELVLETVFGDTMRPGVRQNLVDDLQEDLPWDDFADVVQQRGIFITVVLLQQAFPTRFGTPDARELGVKITAATDTEAAILHSIRADILVRLLACGMDQQNTLHRLYEKELGGGPFAEAPGLIWSCELVESADEGRTQTYNIVSSSQWFAPLSNGQSFQANVV